MIEYNYTQNGRNMLNLITKSEIRKKIILLFIYNPGDFFYINQIARLVKTSAGNVQRELKKIEGCGLLSKEKKGNSTYFKINTAQALDMAFGFAIIETVNLTALSVRRDGGFYL